MAVGTALGAAALYGVIGAGVAGAVHGFRGGRGSGALGAMALGGVSGAIGGYFSPALAGIAGGGVGGVGGSGLSMASLITNGGRIAAGIMMPDYPQDPLNPDWASMKDSLKKEGVTNSQQYYKAFMDQNTATNRALQNVTQGTGEGGIVTYEDLMRSVDPTGRSPFDGEMTEERWNAISPIYNEMVSEEFLGYRQLGQSSALAEDYAGVTPDELGNAYSRSGVPLRQDAETGKYIPYSPFDPVPTLGSNGNIFQLLGNKSNTTYPEAPVVDNPNLLGSESGGLDGYYTTSPKVETQVGSSQLGNTDNANYARQTARYNSFASARASEDALRAQSLLQTSKSLNLPRFDEEYNLAAKRFTQKPKPFS